MEHIAGHVVVNTYLQKVIPAAIYLVDQLNEMELGVKQIEYDAVEYPRDEGRSKYICTNDFSDDNVTISSLLSNIGWTIHRVAVLMYRKSHSELTRKALDELEKKLVYEYGASPYDGEGTGVKQLDLPITRHAYTPSQVPSKYYGNELWYQCPTCDANFETPAEAAQCDCRFYLESGIWRRDRLIHNSMHNGWDASKNAKDSKPNKPTKYNEHAYALIAAVSAIDDEGGE